MSFLELATKRFSVRSFKNQEIEEDKLMYILESGRVAPSAVNHQPWHFIVVRDKELLEKVYSCYKREWIKEAPVVIVICGNHNQAWRRSDGKDHTDIDVSIAIDHMTLAAADKEIGSCWVCKFDVMKCAEIFNLPGHIEPIALLPLGYATERPEFQRHNRMRKPLEEIVSWDKF